MIFLKSIYDMVKKKLIAIFECIKKIKNGLKLSIKMYK